MTLNMASNASSIFGSGMNGIELKSAIMMSPVRRMWSYRIAWSTACGLGMDCLTAASTFGSVIFPLLVDIERSSCYRCGTMKKKLWKAALVILLFLVMCCQPERCVDVELVCVRYAKDGALPSSPVLDAHTPRKRHLHVNEKPPEPR